MVKELIETFYHSVIRFIKNIPKPYRLPLSFIVAGLLLWIYGDLSNADRQSSINGVSGQTAHVYHTDNTTINYLLFLPKSDEKNRKKWPLIVYLHGASLRGDDINRVKRYGPPRMVENNKNFPFIMLSPQCPSEKGWHEVKGIIDLIDVIIKNYNVDENRIYLTGVSLGGSGTWSIAAEHPQKFAAIAPLCGYGNPQNASKFRNLPVWVFHGAKDRIVPVEYSENMVKAIKENDGMVKFSKYPNAGHSIVEEVYQNENLYQWFLSHSR